jgi:hypothetical protein
MIKEISIAGLNNDPIKVKKPNIPQSDNKDLPRFFFNMLLVAQKHSGKTFLLAKLIKNYQKTKIVDNEGNIHKVRVILFAPTAFSESNKIYETLNVDPNDIHVNYSDDQLLNVLDEIKQENDEIKEYKKKLELYEKFKKVKDVHELSDEEILELHMFKFNKHHIEKPKYEFLNNINALHSKIQCPRISNDNITYSSYRNFVIGDYTARYYKFRVMMTSSDLASTPVVSALSVT